MGFPRDVITHYTITWTSLMIYLIWLPLKWGNGYFIASHKLFWECMISDWYLNASLAKTTQFSLIQNVLIHRYFCIYNRHFSMREIRWTFNVHFKNRLGKCDRKNMNTFLIAPNHTLSKNGFSRITVNTGCKGKIYRIINGLPLITTFVVTSGVIRQLFSRVTQSRVKIIGESPHKWPQTSLLTAAHI